MEKAVSIIKGFFKTAIIIIAVFAIAAILIAAGIYFADKAYQKSRYQPMICDGPVFPETIPAENGGEYVRRLSLYWWVEDVQDGLVILDEPNKYIGGLFPSENVGLISLDGTELIPFENREIHFTRTGYISVWLYDGSTSWHKYYSMDVALLDTFLDIPREDYQKYEGIHDMQTVEQPTVPAEDTFGAYARYFGNYLVLEESGGRSRDHKLNTCIYELETSNSD